MCTRAPARRCIFDARCTHQLHPTPQTLLTADRCSGDPSAAVSAVPRASRCPPPSRHAHQAAARANLVTPIARHGGRSVATHSHRICRPHSQVWTPQYHGMIPPTAAHGCVRRFGAVRCVPTLLSQTQRRSVVEGWSGSRRCLKGGEQATHPLHPATSVSFTHEHGTARSLASVPAPAGTHTLSVDASVLLAHALHPQPGQISCRPRVSHRRRPSTHCFSTRGWHPYSSSSRRHRIHPGGSHEHPHRQRIGNTTGCRGTLSLGASRQRSEGGKKMSWGWCGDDHPSVSCANHRLGPVRSNSE